MDASPPRGIKHLKLRDVIEAIRKMTAAIRLSDKNFGAAADVRGAALGVLSPDGRFILANNSACACRVPVDVLFEASALHGPARVALWLLRSRRTVFASRRSLCANRLILSGNFSDRSSAQDSCSRGQACVRCFYSRQSRAGCRATADVWNLGRRSVQTQRCKGTVSRLKHLPPCACLCVSPTSPWEGRLSTLRGAYSGGKGQLANVTYRARNVSLGRFALANSGESHVYQ